MHSNKHQTTCHIDRSRNKHTCTAILPFHYFELSMTLKPLLTVQLWVYWVNEPFLSHYHTHTHTHTHMYACTHTCTLRVSLSSLPSITYYITTNINFSQSLSLSFFSLPPTHTQKLRMKKNPASFCLRVGTTCGSASSTFSMKHYRAKPSAQLPKHMHIIALLL